MQSMFRLPWCTEQLANGSRQKIYGQGASVDMAAYNQLKRKRDATPDHQDSASEIKRQRSVLDYSSITTNRSTVAIPPTVSATVTTKSQQIAEAMEDVATVNTSARNTKLEQAIENQFNMQILLKHNELRLIEQELAKCQIALEQLRRCELRPYPGDEVFDQTISDGTGAAVMPPTGFTKASHAAPYGVSDGPYSRHYRQWLLSDAQFDSQPYAISPVDDSHLVNRATRLTGSRKTVPVATPQRQGTLQTLPSYTAPAPRKDCSAPLVLRRSTDNKLVKLVCNNCNRGNMSSIQGFLNHCRIAHKVIYESHDAAAIDCGRILDDAEIANLPTETQSMPVSKPITKHTPSRTSSTTTTATTPAGTIAVHSLNRVNATLPQSKVTKRAKPAPSLSTASSTASTPFKPAAGLPKLSALFAQRNCGGDLEQAVIDARRKSDLLDDVLSPLTPGTPTLITPGRANARLSGKGLVPQQRSYFASAQPESPQEPNLSPHAIDSNPGLVSDVEDDDNGSASEEESHHAPLVPHFAVRRDCTDNMDVDMDLQHGVFIRRNSVLSADRNVGGSSRKFGN